MAYYVDNGYLERVDWQDGTPLYCRKCDAKTPFHRVFGYVGGERVTMLEDSSGHRMHPAQALASGELNSK